MRPPGGDPSETLPLPSLGCLALNFMLAAPILGYAVGGSLGLIVGLILGCVVLAWLLFVRPRRGLMCDYCRRPLINIGQGIPGGSPFDLPGAFVRTSDLRAGLASFGAECTRCHRVFCDSCGRPPHCRCGSGSFKTVTVRYH